MAEPWTDLRYRVRVWDCVSLADWQRLAECFEYMAASAGQMDLRHDGSGTRCGTASAIVRVWDSLAGVAAVDGRPAFVWRYLRTGAGHCHAARDFGDAADFGAAGYGDAGRHMDVSFSPDDTGFGRSCDLFTANAWIGVRFDSSGDLHFFVRIPDVSKKRLDKSKKL